MADKPLVIDTVDNAGAPSQLNKWRQLDQQDKFIGAIKTPTLNEDSDGIGAIVSGIPTVFARVNLFRSAIDTAAHVESSAAQSEDDNIKKYYIRLANEWKGLVAAIACDYPNFNVRRVDMKYSDNGDITTTANLYEPKGSFGNMLIVGRDKWCNLEKGDPLSDVPFIDIIKYDGQVVGGTSPDTMLFTSNGYKLDNNGGNRPWIDVKTGRFTDPLRQSVTQEQLRVLYAYCEYLSGRIPVITKYFNDNERIQKARLQVDYSNLAEFLKGWKKEMARYATERGWVLEENPTPPTVNIFDLPAKDGQPVLNHPYSDFFNYQNKLWGYEGNIFDSPEENPHAIPFDPQEILLPADSEIAWVALSSEARQNISSLPVYLLKANVAGTNNFEYFALPLTPKALKVFGVNLGSLVGAGESGSAVESTLKAVFIPNSTENNLRVTITFQSNNRRRSQPCERAYTIKPTNVIRQRDILIWPNFISKFWNRYFLFSELPHNVASVNYPYRAFPFVGEGTENNEFRTIEINNQPMRLAERGKVVADSSLAKVKLLVESNNLVSTKKYQYEIYESSKPFKGVELMTQNGKNGGFIVIRYERDNSSLPQNYFSRSEHQLKKVNLGIDFGSTNSSIAYFDPNGGEQVKGFTFNNLRVSLFGNNKPSDTATPNELFFFPNTPVRSNAVKSILALHDTDRMGVSSESESRIDRIGAEIKGGFPCFVRNLPINSIGEGTISVNLERSGEINLINNMKWTESEDDIAHKSAFLKTLLLMTYAQLFRENFVPTALNWSYPSAMSDNLCNRYQQIWRSLDQVSPIATENMASQTDRDSLRLKIAKYQSRLEMKNQFAAPADNNFSNDNIFGGATDDIFGGGMSGDIFAAPVQPKPAPAQQSTGGIFDMFDGDSKTEATGPTWQKEDPQAKVDFTTTALFRADETPNVSLSEACAVANYLSTDSERTVQDGELLLCFDIGGSTTDITALCKIGRTQTMIKQNSIRFAAQNVAEATRYSPNFHNVLLSICNRYGLKIEGLTGNNSSYSPETAPYFFEQIVDVLTPEQLIHFYGEINTRCQELMNANLFVTGLIMYYAGQICAKLIEQIRTNGTISMKDGGKMRTKITFAGKGSRLFEWWSSVDANIARKYYFMMFFNGMGGQEKASYMITNDSNIFLPTGGGGDVKYEVSKGLASSNTDLNIVKDNTAVEIIGEEGFMRVENNKREPLPSNHILTPEMMMDLGNSFGYSAKGCPCFRNFCGFYFSVASQVFNLKLTQQDFVEAFQKDITGYIQNHPEYRRAQNEIRANKDTEFSFLSPIIILEGARFYKEKVLESLKQSR